MPLELTEDERYLSAHIRDLRVLSQRSGTPRFSSFLNEREAMIARESVRAEGADPVFFGGCDGAQRTVCGFFEETYAQSFDEDAKRELFPVEAAEFSFRACDKLSHRDFLGAVLSMGIKRETVGDIIVSEGRAVVFFLAGAGSLVLDISKVGKVGVAVRSGLSAPIEMPGTVKKVASVSSLRLDCIVGACANVSREKSASLVKSGQVSADFSVCLDVSCVLKENTVLSVRGYGRFRLGKVLGMTKKDRIRVEIEKFV